MKDKKAKIAVDKEVWLKNEQIEFAFNCKDHNANHEQKCNFYAFTKNTLIGNTTASCCITNNDDGMFDVKH